MSAAFGLYQDQVTALETVDALKHTGFRSTDMSILVPDSGGGGPMQPAAPGT